MSITPIAPAVPAPVAETAPGGADPAAEGFAALVAGLLAGTPGAGTPLPGVVGTPETAVVSEEVEETEAGDEPTADAPDGAEAVADPAAALALGVLPLPATWQAPAMQAGVADEAASVVAGVADTPVEAAPHAAAVGEGDAPEGATQVPAPASTDDAGATQAAVAPTTTPVPEPAQQPSTPTAATSTVVLAPTAAAAPSAPVAAPEGARPAMPASPVAQVAPEVTRLVSRGNGVHRLTMKLQPEALGEVRVTLTVRDGAVQVRLTGGDDAARALAEGAPELRRVLEMTGATEARVVVRDLAGQPAAQPVSQTGVQAGTPDSSYAGSGGDSPASGREAGQQDQHARTRGGAGARDGLTDGATALRPDPVTAARQGIDLTM